MIGLGQGQIAIAVGDGTRIGAGAYQREQPFCPAPAFADVIHANRNQGFAAAVHAPNRFDQGFDLCGQALLLNPRVGVEIVGVGQLRQLVVVEPIAAIGIQLF